MNELLEKLEAAIEEKVENEWLCSRYGDIDKKWKARRIEQEHDKIIAKLLED